ncbi:CopD family protein [Halosimplex litoreum]|uniref:CopD family protein n=1 Tax=Halosimplex litoreum TaxID=1198301 RepID=A0A7T3FYG6_9EURY|nr:CopD family protein [Halosimplex litoreum]QPV63025.1 CopD family protein [Halosimplex litoreum]
MSAIDTAMYVLHLVFGGVWTGSVVFVTFAILPLAQDGTANAEPLRSVVERLRWVSRASALVLLASGGHMAGTLYTVESLTGSPRGHLVLTMVALWLGLAALVEIGSSKLADGFDQKKVRQPARDARPFLLAASVVAAGLLVVGGLLASPTLL